MGGWSIVWRGDNGIRLITFFFYLGTLDSLGAILNSEITKKKNKNVKKHGTKSIQKGHMSSLRAETGRWNIALWT